MLPGSCIRIIALVAADLAIVLMRLNMSWNRGVLVTVTILATLAVGIAVFAPLLGGRSDYSRFQPEGESSERKRLEGLAESAGLSARETTVFQLLVMGKSSTEIKGTGTKCEI